MGAIVGRGDVQHLVPRDQPTHTLNQQALLPIGQDTEPDRAAVLVLAARDATAVAQAGVLRRSSSPNHSAPTVSQGYQLFA